MYYEDYIITRGVTRPLQQMALSLLAPAKAFFTDRAYAAKIFRSRERFS